MTVPIVPRPIARAGPGTRVVRAVPIASAAAVGDARHRRARGLGARGRRLDGRSAVARSGPTNLSGRCLGVADREGRDLGQYAGIVNASMTQIRETWTRIADGDTDLAEQIRRLVEGE